MKEYVLIEFLLPGEDYPVWSKKLEALGEDYIPISSDSEFEIDQDGYTKELYIRVQGKIFSEYASMIKLTDPYLAKHMRVSYIPEDLKDRYRK